MSPESPPSESLFMLPMCARTAMRYFRAALAGLPLNGECMAHVDTLLHISSAYRHACRVSPETLVKGFQALPGSNPGRLCRGR